MLKQISRVLFFCSGASIEILEKDKCKTVRSKYLSLGVGVLLTGVMATISMTYAAYTVPPEPNFISKETTPIPKESNSTSKETTPISKEMNFTQLILSVGCGVLWGIAIFNLDRFLVSTIRREKSKTDNLISKVFNSVKPWVSSSPRIVLSIGIGMIISTPLELRICQQEIIDYLKDKNKSEISLIEQEIAEKEKEQRNFEIWGPGQVSQAAYAQSKKTVTEQNLKIIAEKKERIRILTRLPGPVGQYDILEELKSGKPHIEHITWAIRLLFIFLDTVPVILKLSSKIDPYEEIVNSEEKLVEIEQEEVIKIKEKESQEKSSSYETLKLHPQVCNLLSGKIEASAQDLKESPQLNGEVKMLVTKLTSHLIEQLKHDLPDNITLNGKRGKR